MAELINSILLSSGTVVKIPIFPVPETKQLPAACSIYTRSGGVLAEKHDTGTLPSYMAVTPEDMLELARIFWDVDAAAIDFASYTVGGHNVQLLLWSTNPQGEYILANPFKNSGLGAHIVALNYRFFPYDDINYWNGTSGDGSDFYAKANAVNSYVAIPYCNIREGGKWSIDIATRSKDSTPYGSGEMLSVQNVLNRIARYQQRYPNSNVAI